MKKLSLKDQASIEDEIIRQAADDATAQGNILSLDGSLESASLKLRAFVERVERLKEEQKAIGSDITDVMNAAKSEGFDPAVIKDLVKLRAMDDPRSRLELLALYCRRMGMEWPE
jgi:uncharacterized protein (UPF0335 family)